MTAESYNLTEDDRQLLLCAAGELAAARPDLLHRLTHVAYRLKGIQPFEEFHKRAKLSWISVPASVRADVEMIRLVPPPAGPHAPEIGRKT